MNDTQTAPAILHTEYPNSDRPTTFDPVDRDSAIYVGQETHRVTAQLLQWAIPKILAWHTSGTVAWANGGGHDLNQWGNHIGCDCSFLVESLKGVRAKDRWLGRTDEREIIDAIIYVGEAGWTTIQPIYKGEKVDVDMPLYEHREWIIVCREFEANLGHGIKWLEISPQQAIRLLQKYNDECLTKN